MAQSKSTKKFEKRHLKDTIKRRKDNAKIKQKITLNEKRKARRTTANASNDGPDDKRSNGTKSNALNEMSVDDFFQGGFDLPEHPKTLKRKEVKPKTGKRKRTKAEEEDGEEEVSSSDDSLPEAGGIDKNEIESEPDNESGDELEDHKAQINALAEKDPEFYKYLQENDAELLQFPDDDALEAIGELSEDDEAPQRKKAKSHSEDDSEHEDKIENEVTRAMVEKWRKSMSEQNSIRAMREVVIAFRAAAHTNEGDAGKTYKYTVTSAKGTLEPGLIIGATATATVVLTGCSVR